MIRDCSRVSCDDHRVGAGGGRGAVAAAASAAGASFAWPASSETRPG